MRVAVLSSKETADLCWCRRMKWDDGAARQGTKVPARNPKEKFGADRGFAGASVSRNFFYSLGYSGAISLNGINYSNSVPNNWEILHRMRHSKKKLGTVPLCPHPGPPPTLVYTIKLFCKRFPSRPVSRRISCQPPAEKITAYPPKKIRLAGSVTRVVDGDFAVTMTATLCSN